MTEKEHFMVEAAVFIGFEIIDDDGSVFRCTDKQIVELMTRAREQGRKDVRDGLAS